MKREVTVIGAGVIGLSTGIRLLERGYPVRLVARELPPETTSNRAAAIWYPYRAYPEERVLGWGRETFAELVRLMDDAPESGVFEIELLELFDRPAEDPWWRPAAGDFRRARPEELPPGYRDAYVVTVPVIDTSRYMAYLVDRLRTAGGRIEQREVRSLDDLAGQLIVNCAGLGARTLVGDQSLFPIRGQVVRVKAPRVLRACIDEEGPRRLAYIIPRQDDVILGGTAEEGEWDLTPDPATAASIIDTCRAIDPDLAGLEILDHAVGLRPGRPVVRLESESRDGGAIIHNYGHGGAGFTLSWGCAAEAADLVDRAARGTAST